MEELQRPPQGRFGLTLPSEATEEDESLERRRRALQIVVAVAALVPVAAGSWGLAAGAGLTGDRLGISGDSHYRYLSGLLLGIGIAFWTCIPAIESRGRRMWLLTCLVLVGGMGRLLGVILNGWPDAAMLAALVMELAVTPAICLWQTAIAGRYRAPDESSRSKRYSRDPEMSDSERSSPTRT